MTDFPPNKNDQSIFKMRAAKGLCIDGQMFWEKDMKSFEQLKSLHDVSIIIFELPWMLYYAISIYLSIYIVFVNHFLNVIGLYAFVYLT